MDVQTVLPGEELRVWFPEARAVKTRPAPRGVRLELLSKDPQKWRVRFQYTGFGVVGMVQGEGPDPRAALQSAAEAAERRFLAQVGTTDSGGEV